MFVRSLIAAAVAVASNAAVAAPTLLLQYGTAPSTTTAAQAPVFAEPSVSGSLISAGSGLTANTGSTFNWRGWDTASTSFDAAVAANDFWTFTLTAISAVNLTTLDIRLDRSGTGPDDFELRASQNGGTAVSILSDDFADTEQGRNYLNVDLSAFSLAAGDTLSFVLAAFNSETSTGTFDLETITFPGGTDAISIYGELAPVANPVPVPAAVWLLGSAVAGMAGVARRKAA